MLLTGHEPLPNISRVTRGHPLITRNAESWGFL